MTLEELSAERPRAPLKLSIGIITTWLVWLSFVSTLSLPNWIAIPCTSFVVLFGVFYWSIYEGLFIFLLMGFLYHWFSITPPALFWLSLTSVFIFFKLLIFRLAIQTPAQLLFAIFLGSVLLDLAQWIFIRMVLDFNVFSWSTLGGIFLSALFQTLLAVLLVRPLLAWVAHK